MRPLDKLTADEARSLEGLLLDLDDTVLDHGRLTEQAYGSLWRAVSSGLRVVAVTGRPLGWGELLARMWPLDGVVSENGAVASRRDGNRLVRMDRVDTEERAARWQRLLAMWAEIKARFPDLQRTDDANARHTDLTIDVGETVTVPAAQIREVARMGRERGARVTVSSVHLHLSLEQDDKASGAVWFLGEVFGVDASRALSRYAFVGDSGNDAACFAAFHSTFAVANVAPFMRSMSVTPRFVAPAERGAGFSQIIDAILTRR